MNAQSPIAARSTAKWREGLIDRIDAAFNKFTFEDSEAFRALAELSQSTEVVGQVLDFESTVIDGDQWTTPGTVFVTLRYDVNSDDPVELDDAYPIAVKFQVNGNEVSIQSITADVSSFYE